MAITEEVFVEDIFPETCGCPLWFDLGIVIQVSDSPRCYERHDNWQVLESRFWKVRPETTDDLDFRSVFLIIYIEASDSTQIKERRSRMAGTPLRYALVSGSVRVPTYRRQRIMVICIEHTLTSLCAEAEFFTRCLDVLVNTLG